LQAHGLSACDVTTALNSPVLIIPAGTVKIGDTESVAQIAQKSTGEKQ
jgi:hypothetical protein